MKDDKQYIFYIQLKSDHFAFGRFSLIYPVYSNCIGEISFDIPRMILQEIL